MRDGIRLAVDLYLPDPTSGRAAARGDGVHPLPQGRGTAGKPLLRVSPAAGLHRGQGRHPRHRRLGGHQHGRIRRAGAAGRLRRDRVARRSAVLRRPRQPDGDLLRRLHLAPGRDPSAATSDQHRPHVLHGRPLHGRLPLPRRPPQEVLRHRPLRQLHDRLQRATALPRVVRRRLGDHLGRAHRPKRAIPAQLAEASDQRALLAARLRP